MVYARFRQECESICIPLLGQSQGRSTLTSLPINGGTCGMLQSHQAMCSCPWSGVGVKSRPWSEPLVGGSACRPPALGAATVLASRRDACVASVLLSRCRCCWRTPSARGAVTSKSLGRPSAVVGEPAKTTLTTTAQCHCCACWSTHIRGHCCRWCMRRSGSPCSCQWAGAGRRGLPSAANRC